MPPSIRPPIVVSAVTALIVTVGACGDDAVFPPTLCPPDCAPEPVREGEWTEATPPFTAHREMGAAVIGDRIYVPGGISASRSVMAGMSVYDVAAGVWSTGPAMPEPRHHHGVAAVDGKLYVIGGYSSLEPHWGPWPVAGSVFEFDPESRVWTTKRSMPLPVAAAAVAAYDGRIYVFGGVASERERDETYIYDPATDSWSGGQSMPTAREHVAAVVLDSAIFVIAGRRFESTNVGAVEVYSPESDSWRTAATISPTSGHGVAVMEGRIYVFGGENLGTGSMSARAWEYDPGADSWQRVADLPSARHGAPAVGLGDRIHVIGGHGTGLENLVFRMP